MARKSLADLRKRFQEEKTNKGSFGEGKFSRNTYPFWKMNIGERAVTRLLPDKNEENPNVFFVDKLEHVLSINGKDKKIPCLKMYGDKCPICDLSSKYYKQEGKESEQGKYYYRKRQSLVRLYILEDPLPADETTGETYNGATANTQFGYQLMEKIREQIESGDLEHEPWDEKKGANFIIKKSAQGQYGTYAIGSGFSNKSTPIPDDVELIDLSTLLPKNIGIDKVEAMLSAHVNGTEYDDGDETSETETDEEVIVSKPAKVTAPAKTVTKPARQPLPVVTESDDEDDEDDSDSDEEDDDLMAAIRNRTKAAKG